MCVRVLTEADSKRNNEDDEAHGNTTTYQDHFLDGEQREQISVK